MHVRNKEFSIKYQKCYRAFYAIPPRQGVHTKTMRYHPYVRATPPGDGVRRSVVGDLARGFESQASREVQLPPLSSLLQATAQESFLDSLKLASRAECADEEPARSWSPARLSPTSRSSSLPPPLSPNCQRPLLSQHPRQLPSHLENGAVRAHEGGVSNFVTSAHYKTALAVPQLARDQSGESSLLDLVYDVAMRELLRNQQLLRVHKAIADCQALKAAAAVRARIITENDQTNFQATQSLSIFDFTDQHLSIILLACWESNQVRVGGVLQVPVGGGREG